MDESQQLTAESPEFVEHLITADGFPIRYLEAGGGQPLVMLHGAGGLELTLAHHLLATRFRVIALEFPGFGAEINERTKNAREMAVTIAAAVEGIGVDGYALLGTSMGGVVASWQAVQFPDRVSALVLEAPAAFRSEIDMGTLTPEQIMIAFHAHPERKEIKPPDLERQARVWPLVERLVGPAFDEELAEALKQLWVPTLVMHGTRDGVVGTRSGSVFKGLVARCVFTLLYDAAHDLAGDRPEAYTELVSDFVERQERFHIPRTSSVINR
ncbi:alpha/beta fold hydrolase [Streptomyces griseorubiginosus]|uniref:alpha/beta fold hydrolase n=1 Tax=Streptomyces griseorubiginosus TaxID=67304 RepID=UPI001AD7730A|nr:alpha/beta hydrolase [Streptomyces griseorubiginosus]MBO4252318.1 alpha/beta fold hydrolase [Streptomyces griseorubiginosus]